MATSTATLAQGQGRGSPTRSLVSVIIPTYNRSYYLPEAINSVLRQTHAPIEIIVVDDGSSDNTREIVGQYGDRIQYVYQENAGLSAALNTGIKYSTGRYLAFLDDDDIWKDRTLARSIEMLDELGKEFGVVYVDCRYFFGNDKNHLIDAARRHYTGYIVKPLLRNNFIPVNTILIKRECMDKVGGFDVSLRGYQDWDFLLRIALAGFKFEYIDEPLALIRIHDSNMSSDSLLMKQDRLKVLEKLEHYQNGDPKEVQLIKKEIGKRRLLLGWYLVYLGDLVKGKEEFFKVSPVGTIQRIQNEIFRILLMVHPFFLKKLYSFFKYIYDRQKFLLRDSFLKKTYSFFPSRIKSGH